MEEIWKDVPGFEGLYQVSNLGRVKRLPLGKQWPYRRTHNNIRKAIRKLTERECFRLMDVNESDIDKIQDSGVSRSRQYCLTGNSIVVACMEGIFYNLFSNEQQEQTTLF